MTRSSMLASEALHGGEPVLHIVALEQRHLDAIDKQRERDFLAMLRLLERRS